MPHTCQIGGWFSRCHEPAFAACQYCGREFCSTHGERLPTGDEICSRLICREKHADLQAHLAWKARAVERSNRGFCGMPDCEGGRWGQCSKCLALFCERHLRDREERIRQGMGAITRPASMCDHCAARLKLWSRI